MKEVAVQNSHEETSVSSCPWARHFTVAFLEKNSQTENILVKD
jgi:hypothetical protein